jgi:hypothetical protein
MNITGVDFQLEVGGTIEGFVFEQDGQTPVAGICVYVSSATPPQWNHAGGTCCTDENGFYSIASLAPGTLYARADAGCGPGADQGYIDETPVLNTIISPEPGSIPPPAPSRSQACRQGSII